VTARLRPGARATFAVGVTDADGVTTELQLDAR
jgi:hypothetical protein